MRLDLPTLIFADAMLSFAFGVTVLAARPASASARRAARVWALSGLSLGLGRLALLVPAVLPQAVPASIVTANTLLLCGYLLIAQALGVFCGRPLGRAWLLGTPAGIAALFVSLPTGPTGFPVRVGLYALVTVALIGLALDRLRRTPSALNGRRLVGAALLVHAGVLLLRLAGATVWSADGLLAGFVSQGVLFLSNLAVSVVATMGFLMMLGDRARRQSERQARQDPLTDLPNRRGIQEGLDSSLDGGGVTPVSVVVIDLDHFKSINDRWGHAAGDRTLRAFAECLRGVVRAGDLPGRMGGEEFVLVLPGVDGRGAREVVERLRRRLRETPIGPDGLLVTFSAGIASSAESDARDPDLLLERADARLYEAKRLRDTVVGCA